MDSALITRLDDKSIVLPDSRAKVLRGVKFINGVEHEPCFCANCHVLGGHVPVEYTTFAYWVCNKCESKWALQAGEMAMPDQVWWERVKQEQLEEFGRTLSDVELLKLIEEDATPLASLIKQGPLTQRG